MKKILADGVKRLVEDKKLYEHIHTYLVNHEYGNSSEIEKYYELFDA